MKSINTSLARDYSILQLDPIRIEAAFAGRNGDRLEFWTYVKGCRRARG